MPVLYQPTSLQKGKSSTIVLVALIALGLGAGAGFFLFKSKPQPEQKVSKIKTISLIGSRRPDFSMKDMEDQTHSLTEWDGKVLVINFWATWCPPCRREIPAFINLQEKFEGQGFSMLGVAVDNKQAAMDFVDPMGINYPILIGESDGIAVNLSYGNQLGVLPYTVIVDRKGIIRHTFTREVKFEEMEKLILPLL